MKALELKFLNEENRVVTFTLDEPIEPADPTAINEAMDQMISENVFYSTGGDLKEKHSARIVERTVEMIEI